MIVDSTPLSNKSHQKGDLVGNLMNQINEKLHATVIAISSSSFDWKACLLELLYAYEIRNNLNSYLFC